MHNRREFLFVVGAAALEVAARPVLRMESVVNDRLEIVADKLRQLAEIRSIDLHAVENANAGLIQWAWPHFHADGEDEEEYVTMELSNDELLSCLSAAHEIPEAGFTALAIEGIVAGREEHFFLDSLNLHRSLVREQLTEPSSLNLQRPHSSAQEIDKEVIAMHRIREPVTQVAESSKHKVHRTFVISPLARLGAGYFFSLQKDVGLLAGEDPVIYERSKEFEHASSDEEYHRWVILERNKHFVRIAREGRERMFHLLAGYKHDLKDAIKASNETYPRQISYMRVNVNSCPEDKSP
jgi:hypothetical protein